uniref:Uncharacterized protein n=1 Tax=Avena sativa TaxID=4498 RepID=A0ACD5ZPM5_AVESA
MHFDLKPDNILLDKHMTPKIADFGLSKLFGEENTKRTISSVGTCGYWPPEYIKHQIISREFDIFSFGVIIVKIMTGHEGYNSVVEMTTRKSIKLVHESWRRRLRGTLSHMQLEVYCNQFYQENGESTVPSEISNITIDCGPSSENFPPVEPRAMPFQLLKNITNDFSRERSLGRKSSLARAFKGVFEDGKVIAVKKLRALGVLEENEMHEIVNHVKVHHQNIVQLVGYCWEKEETVVLCNERYVYASKIHRAMCFEYLPNGSLKQYISGISSGLDWGTRYAIIKGICEGLKCLHEGSKNSRIHMNLKLSNILLDENMTAKIDDFDIVRFLGKGKRSSIDDGFPCSSDRHMPPEFIQRQIISKAFDIYSLGIIVIELVTGTILGLLEMPSAMLIEKAHEEWMQRLQKTVHVTSVEGYFQQVKKCLKIGLQCVERDKTHKTHHHRYRKCAEGNRDLD